MTSIAQSVESPLRAGGKKGSSKVPLLPAFWLLSVLFHVAVFSGAPRLSLSSPQEPQVQEVSFTVAEPEPKPEPEPEPKLEPEPELPRPPPAVREVAPLEPPPAVEETVAEESEEPEAEAAPELTGETLVAEGEGSFSAEKGSGRSRRGPIRAGLSRPVAKKAAPQPKPMVKKPAGPPVVDLKALGRKPKPPNLGSALKRNYPKALRNQGKAGSAKVRARVDQDGRIRLAQIAFESSDGFGSACRKTLLSSRWSPPRDKKGRKVATWISYRCRFEIQ